MYEASCRLVGQSDLMFGRKVTEEKRHDETHEQHEQRTWQQKVAVTKDGQAFVQPFAIKNGLESAGKWLSMKIPGEGKKTYTARFRQGIIVTENVLLNCNGHEATMEDIDPLELFVPSGGERGKGKRFTRIFPTLHEWHGEAKILILDDVITPEILHRHLKSFGQFIGIGSMRCENGGTNGRFTVEDFSTVSVEA